VAVPLHQRARHEVRLLALGVVADEALRMEHLPEVVGGAMMRDMGGRNREGLTSFWTRTTSLVPVMRFLQVLHKPTNTGMGDGRWSCNASVVTASSVF
jgi:hypothetical protein